MKAAYSEKFYRDNWEEFLKPVNGKHYVNLEEEMNEWMQPFKETLPPQKIEQVAVIIATEISRKCLELVKEEMQIIKRLEAGESSLGYTSARQEIEARHKLRQRFEFNCLQLADFKKKYGIPA